MSSPLPLAGIRVIEFAPGTTLVGSGAATSVAGSVLRDLGAGVTQVRAPRTSLDAGVLHDRGRDHDKVVVDGGDLAHVRRLATEADVLIAAGPETLVEGRGLGYTDLAAANPGLAHVRVRPSRNATGPIPDVELLLHARTGLLSQFEGRRSGPVFVDLGLGAAGAAIQAAVGALSLLYEREQSQRGGWCETSLYDGLLTMLPLLIGRAERPTAATTSLWETLGPSIALSFRCADGEYVQLWLGVAGAYDAFLAHLGDPPSELGYAAETVRGIVGERAERWSKTFAQKERAFWLADLAGHDFRCEPVLPPAQMLADPQAAAAGLVLEVDDGELGPLRVLGPVASITAQAAPAHRRSERHGDGVLSGVNLLDLAAFGAGPFAARVLAELGADVVKVEPVTGDPHRRMEPMYAAVQRGKRAIALDLKSRDAPAILERLFRWSDVVHHSGRLGRAEQLGYDEKRVREIHPGVVYVHATGWGTSGPRAGLPANDHLMQALSGIESAAGGMDVAPMHLTGAPVDKFSGWMTACAILAGLYARRRHGTGQSVVTSLLGAALTLKSGAFLQADGTACNGPTVDEQQTGYGAAYRMYRAADGRWVALAIPDGAAWQRLVSAVGSDGLPPDPPPLRQAGSAPQDAELRLERLFATRPADEWLAVLEAAQVPAEAVRQPDRVEFIRSVVDDPVTRQTGRTDSFTWAHLGRLDHVALVPRLGPGRLTTAKPFVAARGEHTREVLAMVGFTPQETEGFMANGTVAGPAS